MSKACRRSYQRPVEGPVKCLVEGPIKGPVEGIVEVPSLELKGHNLSTNKHRYDRAGQTELVKQDMAKEELVNSHDLLGPGKPSQRLSTINKHEFKENTKKKGL
ncbi:hypothetical protein Tco_1035340 [Tanacetum coccineum]